MMKGFWVASWAQRILVRDPKEIRRRHNTWTPIPRWICCPPQADASTNTLAYSDFATWGWGGGLSLPSRHQVASGTSLRVCDSCRAMCPIGSPSGCTISSIVSAAAHCVAQIFYDHRIGCAISSSSSS